MIRQSIADLDTLTVIQPLARFRLPDRNTIITGGLEAATAAGFFYPILFGDREAMGADVPNMGTGGTADLGHIIVSFVGPKDMNETVTDALNQLSALKRIQEGLYEARLLEFRYPAEGNLSKAIWLKSANGSIDLIYPFGGHLDAKLRAGRPFVPDAFFDAISRLAAERARLLESWKNAKPGLVD